MADNSSAAAPENLVQWLEEEQHQQKTALFKIQQQLEQQQNTIWTFGNRVSSLETALNTMMAHSTRVASLEEGLRRTQELLERSQVTDEDKLQQEAAAERTYQAERERDRQDRIDMLQKLETWEREKIALNERIQAIEEGGRRRQEELFQMTQAMNMLEQKDEELNALISGQQSQARHFAEMLGELQQNERTIESQQEVIQGRMQHLADLLNRLESGAAMQEIEEHLTQTLNEQGELHRTERKRPRSDGGRDAAILRAVQIQRRGRTPADTPGSGQGNRAERPYGSHTRPILAATHRPCGAVHHHQDQRGAAAAPDHS